MSKFKIKKGDEVKCVNGTIGVIKSYDPNRNCVQLSTSGWIDPTPHIINVCSINGHRVNIKLSDEIEYSS